MGRAGIAVLPEKCMRPVFVGLALLVIGAAAVAATPEWQDPAVVERNKERPFATHFPFASAADAIRNQPQRATNFLSLNGEWRFKWAPKPADAPSQFWKRDFDVSAWPTIPVPADWVRHGYGRYLYADEAYNFPYDVPRVPENDNPVGSYVHEFEIPADWAGRRIFIHFGSVRTAFYLWVNGREVGYSEDSRLPAEFDLTDYVTPGKNKLALKVLQWADAAYLEGQDMWRMGGIERDVYLYAAPVTRIRDVFFRASLDDAYKDGTIDLDVEVARAKQGPPVGKLRLTLMDGDAAVLTSEEFLRSTTAAEVFNLKGRLPNARQWTAEAPNLYTALIELFDDRGALLEATSLRVGFRRVEIVNGVLTVNGRPITIRGVNRGEFDPRGLHVISRETTRRDIELMKQFNINALRSSHYPSDPYLYELADEYGLYVVDEANVESHEAMNRGDNLADRPEFTLAHLSRMAGMVERDKNHPSIIVWSLGNEAGSGDAFRQMYRQTKARDPSRPIQYEAAGDVDYTDIYVPMYAKVWDVSKYLATRPRKPIILCEYAHMMGNSGGTVRDYWELFYDHPQSQGGFVWDWVDQSLEVRRADGSVYYGYPGDYTKDGIQYSFTDGMMTSLREPQPHAWDVKKAYQPVTFSAEHLVRGELRLFNRYDFRDSSGLDFSWRVEEDGRVIATGPLSVPVLLARSDAVVNVPLPKITPRPGAEYFLTVEARARAADGLVPKGHLVAWEQFQLPLYAPPERSARSRANRLQVLDDGRHLSVSGRGFDVRFERASGALVSLRSAQRELLVDRLQPHFWRAPTDNDIGAKLPEQLQIWKTMPSTAVLRSFTHEFQPDGSVAVRTRTSMGDGRVDVAVDYRVDPTGSVRVSLSFDPRSLELPVLPRLGMQFSSPGTLSKIEWFGRGPQASYADRWAAAPVGRYAGNVADQFYSYVRPQESGNKVDVRWLAVRAPDGAGLLIVGDPVFSGTALNVSDDDIGYSPTHQLHSVDVKPRDVTVVHVDLRQMGLGGDDSWRSTAHPANLIWPRRYDYSFTLRPISAGEDANALARD